MRPIRLTSKRQATIPVEVCEQLGVGPGDELVLEPRVIEDETVWIIRTGRHDWGWVGALARFATDKSHDMAAIRASVALGRASEKPR